MQQSNKLVDIINRAYNRFNKRDIDAVPEIENVQFKKPVVKPQAS